MQMIEIRKRDNGRWYIDGVVVGTGPPMQKIDYSWRRLKGWEHPNMGTPFESEEAAETYLRGSRKQVEDALALRETQANGP